MKPTPVRRRAPSTVAICTLLLSVPWEASGQGGLVVIPRGPLTEEQARAAAQLPYAPTDRALHWARDSLLVSHLELYGTGLGYSVNCAGSGFFKVPARGGRVVAVGAPFCELGASHSASPDGAHVLFFGEPAYVREGGRGVKVADAALLRLDLASSTRDTLRIGCGDGAKDVVQSRTGRLALTGSCRDAADVARDSSCRVPVPGQPPGCRPDARDGIYVSQPGSTDLLRFGGPEDGNAHEPSWSPDGRSVVFSVGANPLPGRWEVTGAEPGVLMIADSTGYRSLGVPGESAAWSPDGTKIAFFADDRDDANELSGGPRIYLMRPDGTNRRRVFMNELVTTYPEWFYGPWPTYVRDGKAFGPLTWSPDARWLAFSRQFEEGASIWLLEIDSGRVERLTAPALW